MAQTKLSGLLVLGVEWGSTKREMVAAAADRLAEPLLQRFQRHQFKATWAVRDLESSFVPMIRAASARQEIALDASAKTRTDPTQGFAFTAMMREQVQQAHALGCETRSVVLDPRERIPYPALARLGIRTVRPSRVGRQRSVAYVQPQRLRHGVWRMPVSAHWPWPNRFLQHYSSRQAAYNLRRARQTQAALHVVFDLAGMAEYGQAAMRSVDRFLETAARLRDAQKLCIARLADVDRLVRLETAARPMRSILRRAA